MQLHLEQEIHAPADRVWEVLGRQFAHIERWSSTIERSRAIDPSEVPQGLTVDPAAPIPGGAKPAGARLSVAPMMMKRNMNTIMNIVTD